MSKKKIKKKKVKKKKQVPLASLENYQLVSVSKLQKAPWNVKEDDALQATKLANNIRRNKQVVNIIVRDMPNGMLEVVDGNHRVDAFKEVGMRSAVAYQLGKVSVAEAKRIALEINETRFKTDHLRMAEVIASLTERFSMDDLESTLPFSKSDIESYLAVLDIELKNAQTEILEDPTDKKEGNTLTLKMNPEDQAIWDQLKQAFASVTDLNEEIFRIVCRSYLQRVAASPAKKTKKSALD